MKGGHDNNMYAYEINIGRLSNVTTIHDSDGVVNIVEAHVK